MIFIFLNGKKRFLEKHKLRCNQIHFITQVNWDVKAAEVQNENVDTSVYKLLEYDSIH